MTRIVTSQYRYKRPPRRKKAVALEGPAVVTVTAKRGRGVPRAEAVDQPETAPANADREPAIVTIRRTPAKILPPGLLPETPEEHQRRGDAADAMWRELVHRATGKRRP